MLHCQRLRPASITLAMWGRNARSRCPGDGFEATAASKVQNRVSDWWLDPFEMMEVQGFILTFIHSGWILRQKWHFSTRGHVDFQGRGVLADGRTVGTWDLLAGKVDLDVVLHVVLPGHHLAAHRAPPLRPHLRHVRLQVHACKTQCIDMGWLLTSETFALHALKRWQKRTNILAADLPPTQESKDSKNCVGIFNPE